MLDNCNYDKWRTAEPDSFWQEDLGDAEVAMIDALDKWRRENCDKIAAMWEDCQDAMRAAWVENTHLDFDDNADEYIPFSGLEDEYDAARIAVRRYENAKRLGRHLGNL